MTSQPYLSHHRAFVKRFLYALGIFRPFLGRRAQFQRQGMQPARKLARQRVVHRTRSRDAALAGETLGYDPNSKMRLTAGCRARMPRVPRAVIDDRHAGWGENAAQQALHARGPRDVSHACESLYRRARAPSISLAAAGRLRT